MAEKVLTDVPQADVKDRMGDFIDNGCIDVQAQRQDNGKWTVTAQCPAGDIDA